MKRGLIALSNRASTWNFLFPESTSISWPSQRICRIARFCVCSRKKRRGNAVVIPVSKEKIYLLNNYACIRNNRNQNCFKVIILFFFFNVDNNKRYKFKFVCPDKFKFYSRTLKSLLLCRLT